jgi:Glyoxalase-like domain
VGEDRSRVRLRQAVIVAGELEPVSSELRSGLGLGEPFCDPGVGAFGLTNAVFALGDCFLEVVAPTRPDTAAGRHLDRLGATAGYMAIFDLEDLEGARARAQQAGVRTVWQIDLPDIRSSHLHPSDMRGAIVSIDRSQPYGTWRWGGPQWTGRIGEGARGRLTAITVADPDPDAVAARWANVLGVPVSGDGRALLRLDDGEVAFVSTGAGGAEGLVEIAVALPPERRGGRGAIELGAVRLRLLDAG